MEPGHAAEGQPTAPRCDGAGDPGRCSSAEAEIGFREILEQVEWKSVQGGGDWHAAATQAGNAVLTVNPHLLIIVERNLNGPEREWRGAKEGDADASDAMQDALHAQLGKDWGFIVEDERPFTAPVWVSEFGTFSDCHKDGPGRSFWRFLTHVEEYIYIIYNYDIC
ncbi:Hypothetical protein SCF082_LOCUS14239 [Durusdinium trenchii]|uniref:Beta-amylase n=1 Tax=Durusdinium trenchii TaxID=1381693 RepID=A0ABP0JXU3_9DINO